MSDKSKRLVGVMALVCMMSIFIVSCSTNGSEGEAEAKKNVVAFLELCRKGQMEEAYREYVSEEAAKLDFSQADFEYSIINIIKDSELENLYIVCTRLEFADGVILNATFRYDIEEGQIDFIDWVVRNT